MSTEVKMSVLPKCDVNNSHGNAAYDAKTVWGPWANLCVKCFQDFGIGLGTGKGQRLVLTD